MKEIIMESTIPLIFPIGAETDQYIIPEDFDFKTTKSGISYIVREIKYD